MNLFKGAGKSGPDKSKLSGEWNERYNTAIGKAKACLDHELFKTYKVECEDALVELFEAWLALPVDENYAYRSLVLSEKIKALRSLGVAVCSVATLTPKKPAQSKEPVKA